ncbi:hypothetical protein [Couchioplanes azureus]|uniref:hypothetical protein n=1 Tax=Couchioplanes caeruleus TaxID=56438 RepID=UPI0019B60228|nr:hypothetical protein [Couchioplanes caeruleus]GGQ69047.1 hypothetical protein GCM10010166_43530 [Couchioplanes caeruleus subsp. azureus]
MEFRGRQPCWLHPHLGTTTVDGRTPRAYMVALRHVVVTLDADPEWRRWWRASGVPECELGIVAEDQDHLRPSADIRKVRGKVRANFTCAAPAAVDRRPAELFPLAVREVTGMFEVIREAIGLGDLPPVPALPDLPEHLAELEVTRKPPQPDVTLSQIQEFFVEDQPPIRRGD